MKTLKKHKKSIRQHSVLYLLQQILAAPTTIIATFVAKSTTGSTTFVANV